MPDKEAQPEVPSSETIHLPQCLTGFTDTRPLPKTDGEKMYTVSTFAQQFIMKHSNLEEISKILQQRYSQGPAEIYRNCIIRASLSTSVRKFEVPYQKFGFDSPENEALAKTLLSYPNIKSPDDLQEFIGFQEKYNLKLCSIPLGDNTTRVDAMEFINIQRKKQKIDGRPTFYDSKFAWFVKRREYERQDLIKDVYISMLTPQDFEKISNFRRFCERRMEELKLSEDKHEMFARQQLKHFQNTPGALFNQPYIVFDPQFNLISNIMTDDQLNYVAQDKNIFCKTTNAKRILRRNKDKISTENFYELFCRRDVNDRKLPPFHELFLEENIEKQLIRNWLNAQNERNNNLPQATASNSSSTPNSIINESQRIDKLRSTTELSPASGNSSASPENADVHTTKAPKVNLATLEIKKEILSQEKSDTQSSDVVCIGTQHDFVIEIPDSDEENEKLIASIHEPTENEFLQRINQVTPPIDESGTSRRQLRGGRSVQLSNVTQRRGQHHSTLESSHAEGNESQPAPFDNVTQRREKSPFIPVATSTQKSIETQRSEKLPSTSRSSPVPKNDNQKTYELRSAEKRKLQTKSTRLRRIIYMDDSD